VLFGSPLQTATFAHPKAILSTSPPVRPCDRTPSGRHWYGAALERGMAHIAIHQVQDGRSVDWMEQVSDASYGATPQA